MTMPSVIPSPRRTGPETPLRYEFEGYSVWLELEQIEGDLDRALDVAAKELHVHRIPSPHVTVEYGMTHLSQDEMRRRFLQDLKPILRNWPPFRVIGVMSDKTSGGEEMSMAWIELTLATSQLHEAMVDLVRGILFLDRSKNGDGNPVAPLRTQKWMPHLSLVYENPEQAQSNLHYSLSIMNRVPTLTNVNLRRVTAIGLWSTEGKMERWKCLERFELDPDNV